ncbi:hypothetical protein Tco_1252155 [Tanacetum coccineum]
MFWHYAKDEFMFTTVRVISKHQDTQVYGVIHPQHLTNQAMLKSEAYMTYRAYATGEKTPKPKTTKKKNDSESSPKTKSTQASKGKRITTLAKGDKPAKNKQSAIKSKGLTVLSEVALTEAQQMKIAIVRSKIQTHNSHISGSGDGVDIQSKVHDEQQQNISGTNERAGDKLEVLDVPKYRSESKEESWTYSQGEDDEDNDEHDSENDNDDKENVSGERESDNDGDDFVHLNLSTYKADDQEEEKVNDDDDDVSSDQMISTPPDYEITEEEENQEDDDNVMRGEQEDEEDEELYGDLNLNLERRDAKMTDAQVNQEKEEVHVTLTTELPVVKKFITESLGAEVLARLSNQPQTSYARAASLSEFELKKILIDKINENKSMNRSDDVMIKTKMKNPPLDQTEGRKEGDRARKSHQKKQLKRSISLQVLPKVQPDLNQNHEASTCKSVAELEYHLEEVFKATHDQLDWHNPEGRSYPRDLNKPLTLIQNARGRQTKFLEVYGAGYKLSMASMPTGEHITEVQNVSPSMDMLPTWKLQKMSTQDTG